MKAPTGKLHLIPVGLGQASPATWLPQAAQELAGQLDVYVAENAKTARAFLKLIGTVRPLQEITIHTLDNKVDSAQIRQWLEPLATGGQMGLVSEAGCPAVADPGAKVVSVAHDMGIQVVPWVGPSSILLSLMASGLEGQRFAFHGYAPVNPGERADQLKAWENTSHKQKQTQILIETPYRNDAMFDTLKNVLKGNTRLCLARSLTTEQEWIRTYTVAEWRTQPKPDLGKQPAIFLFLA